MFKKENCSRRQEVSSGFALALGHCCVTACHVYSRRGRLCQMVINLLVYFGKQI